MSARATVSPPNPLSNIPIGRGSTSAEATGPGSTAARPALVTTRQRAGPPRRIVVDQPLVGLKRAQPEAGTPPGGC